MKIILCTGDSHTQGQGQDVFYDPIPERPVETHDLEHGTGMAFRRVFKSNCYVNLIRDYVCEKTDSAAEDVPVEFLREVKDEVVYNCEGYDMFVFAFAETKQEVYVNIYTDGEFYRRIRFFTPRPKWDDWSVRDIKVMCSGKKEIKIVPEAGNTRLIAVHKYKGDYAVINCGLGSCNCKTYYDLCIDELIDEFNPFMFIAEAHTINDWLSGKPVNDYKEHLRLLIDKMQKNSEYTVLVTVAPILGKQIRTGEVLPTADYYENFVEASRILALEKSITMVDANSEFKKLLEGLSEEEKKNKMYADDWHVNSRGHKLYADKIIKTLGELL